MFTCSKNAESKNHLEFYAESHFVLTFSRKNLQKTTSVFNFFVLASIVEDDDDSDRSALKIFVYLGAAAAQNIESRKLKVE